MAKKTRSTAPGRLSTGLDIPSVSKTPSRCLGSSPKLSAKAKLAADAPVKAKAGATTRKKRGYAAAGRATVLPEEDQQLKDIQTPRDRKARHTGNNPGTKSLKDG